MTEDLCLDQNEPLESSNILTSDNSLVDDETKEKVTLRTKIKKREEEIERLRLLTRLSYATLTLEV